MNALKMQLAERFPVDICWEIGILGAPRQTLPVSLFCAAYWTDFAGKEQQIVANQD